MAYATRVIMGVMLYTIYNPLNEMCQRTHSRKKNKVKDYVSSVLRLCPLPISTRGICDTPLSFAILEEIVVILSIYSLVASKNQLSSLAPSKSQLQVPFYVEIIIAHVLEHLDVKKCAYTLGNSN